MDLHARFTKEEVILNKIIYPVIEYCRTRMTCSLDDDNGHKCSYYDLCHKYFLEDVNPTCYDEQDINQVIDNFMNGDINENYR